jgi:twitching motility protein PilU
MTESKDEGMLTFDQALLALYYDGKITLEEAISNADSKNDLSLAIAMAAGVVDDDTDGLILG